MKLSARSRKSHVAKAQALLPDSRIAGYAVGNSGAYPPLAIAGLVVGALVLLVLTLVVTGRGGFGGLLIVLVFNGVCPPRGLVVADRGVALVSRSMWSSKPKTVVTQVDHGNLAVRRERGSWVRMTVGAEWVWVRQSELQHVTDALASSNVGPPAAALVA